MNTETWLRRALFDLPEPVLEPLRREYLEHLAQAQASGMDEAEALATLGDPDKVNRELVGMYGRSGGRPAPSQVATVGAFRVLWAFWLLPGTMLFLAALGSVPANQLALALALMSWLSVVWLLSARLGVGRRFLWRLHGGMVGLFGYLGHSMLTNAEPGSSVPTLMYAAVLFFSVSLWDAHNTDQKLRRIERLTGRPA